MTRIVSLATTLLLTAALAKADTITMVSGTGTSNTGATFSQTLSYDSGKLTLSIENTTANPALQGFRITAVGLISPNSGLSYSNFTTTNQNFQGIYDFPMPPFDDGTFGASTSETWLGGGKGHVAAGLNNGESATFAWDITGGNVQASDFTNIYVRFKGLELSDKVPGVPGNPVPEPSSVMLLLGGLGLLAARRAKKN